MDLVDRHIVALCKGEVHSEIRNLYKIIGWSECPERVTPLVEGCTPKINPASLEIHLGVTAETRRVLTGKAQGVWLEVPFADFSEDFPYQMQPGEAMLVAAMEKINIPRFLCGQFRLKSSRGRELYEHFEAGFFDPGYFGVPTLELINHDSVPLPLYPKLAIGQLVFTLTLGVPDRDYSVTGRYNGDTKVQRSKG